ncbi:MAG: protein-glutamate methylesterase/protein-glutamine glutaminase [Hyphomicrobiaceae bacterium]
MTRTYRVLVVDDSAFMRRALVSRIETDRRFKVVDTAADGREAVEKTLMLKPDVVTLDVEMPVMNGIEALKAIVAKSSVPVIMVSAATGAGAKITLDALAAGAVDFIPKTRGAELLHEKLLAAVTSNVARKGSAADSAAPPVVQVPARRTIEPLQSRVTTRFPAKIVIIGSSTGGPQALQAVIGGLPANLPVPVVIAQHMPEQFTLALAKRLDETCPPKVIEARNDMALEPGIVYIAPGGMQLRLTTTQLKVSPDRGESLYRPSVDVLAESALQTFGKHVIGVMLTGMGNDGTRGFVGLKKAGGHNISQDQASCVVYGMPRAVYEAGGSDEIVSLDIVAKRVRALLGV